MRSNLLALPSMRDRFIDASIVNLAHLLWTPVERLAEMTGVRSARVQQSLMDEVLISLPVLLRSFTQCRPLLDQWSGRYKYVFSSLNGSPAVGAWVEEGACSLI